MTHFSNLAEDWDREPVSGEVARQYGVLPWRISNEGHLQILLITSMTSRRWIVPKGWPEKGQAPFMSAAIEAFEEAGVIGDIGPQILTEYRYFKELKDGSDLPCLVSLFGFQVRGTLTHWKDAGKRKRRWFNVSEAAKMVSEPELAEYFEALVDDPERLTKHPRERILPVS
ncbi:NUDIX hydrolase [Aquamicrobium zhengzhouense]|uniref:NUDIX hydrolase n=1 Tax=Aquamicrobium zhengzhouense TaxID=2781738 RepID=A0ABS0SD30_9HYPH|nr:NUDIX hydrolase [Aquamicrobium zhengzhouense]MBI1621207.1 NUDIX hydrolase [Aquamicrobium zhengzhouense]